MTDEPPLTIARTNQPINSHPFSRKAARRLRPKSSSPIYLHKEEESSLYHLSRMQRSKSILDSLTLEMVPSPKYRGEVVRQAGRKAGRQTDSLAAFDITPFREGLGGGIMRVRGLDVKWKRGQKSELYA